MTLLKSTTAAALVLTVSGCSLFNVTAPSSQYSARSSTDVVSSIIAGDADDDRNVSNASTPVNHDGGVSAANGPTSDQGTGQDDPTPSGGDSSGGDSSEGGDHDSGGSTTQDDAGTASGPTLSEDQSEVRTAAKDAAKKAEGFADRMEARVASFADDDPRKARNEVRAVDARADATSKRAEADRLVSEWRETRATLEAAAANE